VIAADAIEERPEVCRLDVLLVDVLQDPDPLDRLPVEVNGRESDDAGPQVSGAHAAA
jgi:hypothetical protein